MPKTVSEVTDEEMKNLNIVIIGHVDSGKSTLTGHLLYELGHVTKQQMRANEKKAEEYNKASFEFAFIMDETEEERKRGVTIDVTTRHFSTENRNFVILDAPGHRDFVANMITGAAQASCGILVIDCGPGAFESGWNIKGYSGTTKEHASLARGLGVTQLIVAMNKMEMCDFSKERYDTIKEQVLPYLKRVGFKPADIVFVPISGLLGENLIKKATEEKLNSWYGNDKPCLIDLLDGLRLPQRKFVKQLRASVSDYYQQASGSLIGDCVKVKVEAGVLIEKQDLLIMP